MNLWGHRLSRLIYSPSTLWLTILFSVSLSFKNPSSLCASVEERHRVLGELGCGVLVCTLIHSKNRTAAEQCFLSIRTYFPCCFWNCSILLHYAEKSSVYRLFTLRYLSHCLIVILLRKPNWVSDALFYSKTSLSVNTLLNWLQMIAIHLKVNLMSVSHSELYHIIWSNAALQVLNA